MVKPKARKPDIVIPGSKVARADQDFEDNGGVAFTISFNPLPAKVKKRPLPQKQIKKK